MHFITKYFIQSEHLRVLSGLVTVRGSGLGEVDAVASLELEVVGSVFLVDAIVPHDWHKLTRVLDGDGANLRSGVVVLGGGEGHSGHTSEDYLLNKVPVQLQRIYDASRQGTLSPSLQLHRT